MKILVISEKYLNLTPWPGILTTVELPRPESREVKGGDICELLDENQMRSTSALLHGENALLDEKQMRSISEFLDEQHEGIAA